LINIIGALIKNFIVPLVMLGTTIGIVTNISEKTHLNKLSLFLKSAVMWILGVVLTIFVGVISIEGTLSASVDGLTAKTAKTAISTFIPVVGKIMGDTVDTVIGCTNLLKNAVGIVGIVIILGIVIVPIIKVTILWWGMKLVGALSETIADVKIVRLFDTMSDSYKVLFGILVTVSIMFIIGITIVLRMTNIIQT
jgi:stage III sporulation protein AE